MHSSIEAAAEVEEEARRRNLERCGVVCAVSMSHVLSDSTGRRGHLSMWGYNRTCMHASDLTSSVADMYAKERDAVSIAKALIPHWIRRNLSREQHHALGTLARVHRVDAQRAWWVSSIRSGLLNGTFSALRLSTPCYLESKVMDSVFTSSATVSVWCSAALPPLRGFMIKVMQVCRGDGEIELAVGVDAHGWVVVWSRDWEGKRTVVQSCEPINAPTKWHHYVAVYSRADSSVCVFVDGELLVRALLNKPLATACFIRMGGSDRVAPEEEEAMFAEKFSRDDSNGGDVADGEDGAERYGDGSRSEFESTSLIAHEVFQEMPWAAMFSSFAVFAQALEEHDITAFSIVGLRRYWTPKRHSELPAVVRQQIETLASLYTLQLCPQCEPFAMLSYELLFEVFDHIVLLGESDADAFVETKTSADVRQRCQQSYGNYVMPMKEESPKRCCLQ